jgi:pyrimidine-nucleoside phosphorylase
MSLFTRTIVKKRDGGALSEGEIRDFVRGVTEGTIPDEQTAALLMAVCCRGMTTEETAWLTDAMMRSGETWDLSRHGFVADKHSTGGVGDKVTLVLAPLIAACGVKTGMMSGRGLGHTGGTLDKLEAIPGFRTALPREAFDRLLETVGCALIGQTDSVAPADRRIYALRDVTGTVESIPLITASILSKKLATGAHAVAFDVKTGNGAFMAKPEDAEVLGRAMRDTTVATGRKATAHLTAMDRPLGVTAGNANEVAESIQALRGEGPEDLKEVTFLLAIDLLLAAAAAPDAAAARRALEAAIASGKALERFAAVIEAQGGDPRVCEDPGRLAQPAATRDVAAPRPGRITAMRTRELGLLAIEIGCGRSRKDDVIDPASGLRFLKKTGDAVTRGDVLCQIELGPSARPSQDYFERVAACYEIGDDPARPLPLLVKTL